MMFCNFIPKTKRQSMKRAFTWYCRWMKRMSCRVPLLFCADLTNRVICIMHSANITQSLQRPAILQKHCYCRILWPLHVKSKVASFSWVTLICPRSAPLDTVTFSLLTPLYFVSALLNLCSLFLSKGTSAATSYVFIIQVLYIEVIQFKQAFHFI